MKKVIKLFLLVAVICMGFASCHSYQYTMREPNNRVNLTASDFTLSGQVMGEATMVKVLGIDWARLFGDQKTGLVDRPYQQIPVFGEMYTWMKGGNYALYDMMKKNPGYDVVFYPQFYVEKHAPILGTDLYSKTTIKATARLGKLK